METFDYPKQEGLLLEDKAKDKLHTGSAADRQKCVVVAFLNSDGTKRVLL